MSSNELKERMTQARELIKAKHYDEAKRILQSIDHPMATQWLDQIKTIESARGGSANSSPAGHSSAWENRTPLKERAATASPAMSADFIQNPKLTSKGVMLLTVTVLVAGPLFGALLFFSSLLTYLIFFSIIIAAAVAAAAVRLAVKFGKVRVGSAAIIAGVVIGLLLYGTFRYAEYVDFITETHDFVHQEDPTVSDAEIDTFINELLQEETGATGFIGFVRLNAQEGMTINSGSRYSMTETVNTLSSELTVGYWILELLIVTLGPAFFALGQTREKFCEETNEWFAYKRLGAVPRKSSQEYLALLNQGQFGQARQLMNKNGAYMVVYAGRCSSTSADARMKITIPQGRNTKEIVNTAITAEQYRLLTGD